MSDAPPPGSFDADAGAPSPAPSAGNADVIVYGTAWCGACQGARRFLVDKGIPFVDTFGIKRISVPANFPAGSSNGLRLRGL
jgi:hypothetical protein